MNRNKLQNYKLKITTLSPIHIGTGEVYEPTNYVIDNGYFYEFDEVLFYKGLSHVEKKLFDSKLHDYMQVIDFYKSHKDEAKTIANFICRVYKNIENIYQKQFNKDNSKNKNQLFIDKTFKNPNTKRAIIPGSSIKGMLDTALQIYPAKVKENEKRQQLIISDAILLKGGVEIGKADRRHKNPNKQSKDGIYQMIEVVEPNSEFIFTINTELSFDELQKSLKRYHNQRDDSKFYQTDKSFVARVGKNEGKAYLVDNGTNVLNNDNRPVATHFLYNSDILQDEQFGWINIEVISDVEYKNSIDEIQLKEKKYFLELEQRQKDLKNRLKLEKEKKEKEKKEKELCIQKDLEKAKQAKELEEKRLASLDPFELKIDTLIKAYPDPNATKSVILYQAYETGALEEFKKEALRLIKEEMIQENIWDKPKKKSAYKRTQNIQKWLVE